ncbi:MAG: HAMP domain-containing histidine kinase [Phycisphaerae bacterium]|jgi:signal transduction histidine kinase
MATHGFFDISLAAKCRLLFGLAVALIIGAALFIPWRMLERLAQDRNVQRARSAAFIAYAWIDPTNPDWGHQQELLDQWWKTNVATADLRAARVRLIPLAAGGSVPGGGWRFPAGLRKPALWTAAGLARLWPDALALPLEPLMALAWRHVPQPARQQASAWVARLTRHGPPLLDDVQRRAVEEMRTRPVNEYQPPDQPLSSGTTHRYLLGVRDTGGERAGALIGLIDVELPAPETRQAVLATRIVIGLAGSLAGFLAILVFYLITQKLILAPVRELKTLAEQIAGGDLTARAQIDTGDEFEELSVAFNDMLGQLERARLELETINRSLDTRLGELAESNVALYEANRVKSEFLANVSHELRTPLTSIIGFADLLRDAAFSEQPADRGRLARYAHNILTSGRMLLDIINDLLDLAKIEAGRVDMHRTTFALRDVCETLADFMQPMVDKKEQTLTLELDDDLPIMYSDAGKIRQVIYNLLSNANKYTPQGGSIRLEARRCDDGRVRIVVEDNGPGIAPEDQQRIFEKFRQLDSSVTREHSGTGLGLAISRELCAMLGGSIRVDSAPGQGARLIVELPVESPETAKRPLPSLT